MNNNVYLIHEDDYIKHINEKVMLYSFVKQLTHHLVRMKLTRETEGVARMAKNFDIAAENLFDSWGIPKSYLVFDNKEDLAELMENELIAPEDAGYYPCDDECDDFCPCNCKICCEAEDEYEEDDEDNEDEYVAELIGELTTFIHSIFGDNVSVRIIVE